MFLFVLFFFTPLLLSIVVSSSRPLFLLGRCKRVESWASHSFAVSRGLVCMYPSPRVVFQLLLVGWSWNFLSNSSISGMELVNGCEIEFVVVSFSHFAFNSLTSSSSSPLTGFEWIHNEDGSPFWYYSSSSTWVMMEQTQTKIFFFFSSTCVFSRLHWDAM